MPDDHAPTNDPATTPAVAPPKDPPSGMNEAETVAPEDVVSESPAPETTVPASAEPPTPSPEGPTTLSVGTAEALSADGNRSETPKTPAGDSSAGGQDGEPSAESKPRLKIGSQRKEGDATKPEPKAKPQIAPSIDQAAEHKRKDFPPPNIREKLSPELEKELEQALGGASLDSLIDEADSQEEASDFEPGASVKGTVVKIHRDDVFVDLGGRNQGVVSLRQFDEVPPEPGTVLDLVVSRVNPEDGLYEVSRPNAAVDIGNWDDVQEGAIIEVEITGSNKGGLECKVSGIRGFIPMGQISLYRIENPEEFVGQRLPCVVSEVNRDRKNLVMSHRAVMEREKAAAREKLLQELAPGQIREGIVRSLRDFGAFVDLGGVDGLVHISKLSWDRVDHPSEVLKEGETIKVRVEKIDPDTGKIGLSYRDLMDNPWDSVEKNYFVGMTAGGRVSKIMDFGAFVRLEAGVEGLIHISELAHGRVFRTSDAVSEGQEVDVKILSIDRDAQRISLSLKALQAKPEQPGDKKKEQDEYALPKDAPKAPGKQKGELKGGVGQSSGGDKFGLKW